MKPRNFLYTGLLLIMTILLASCSQLGLNQLGTLKGIDEPIALDGYQVQVISLEFMENIGMGSQSYSPRLPWETFLRVNFETDASSDELENQQWNIELEDNTGYYHSPSIRGIVSFEAEEKNTGDWVFAVNRDAEAFTLHINDQEIVLDSLVPEREEAETEQSISEQQDDSIISIGLDFCDADFTISAEKEVRIYFLNRVDSREQGEEYIAKAQFEVSLDGVKIAPLQGELVEHNNQVLVKFDNNLGLLEPGRHTVEASLSFTDKYQRDETFSCVIITK